MGKTLYHRTDETDRILKECYRTGGRGFLKRAAQVLGWNYKTVYRHAAELGLTQNAKPSVGWSDSEVAIIQSASHKSLPAMQALLHKAGYERTVSAIKKKLQSSGIHRSYVREDRGIYSAKALAACLGCDPKTVVRFIRHGFLKAEARMTRHIGSTEYENWSIRTKDVRKFLLNYTAHVDHRKCDKFWLFDILSGESNAKG